MNGLKLPVYNAITEDRRYNFSAFVDSQLSAQDLRV